MTGLAMREGLLNVRRHGALTVVLSGATGLVLVMGAFVLTVGQGISGRLAAWESRVEVVAFVPADTTTADVTRILDALSALPGVAGVVYTSPEEGWRELIADAGAAEDLVSAAEVGLVPGAFTLHLRPGHAALDELERLAAQCAAVEGVADVQFAADLLARYSALRQDLARISALTVLLVVLLLGGLTFATLRLGLRSRRQELRSWVWEGAGPRFLTVVFAAEAGVQGLLGGLWALGLYAIGSAIAGARWNLAVASWWNVPLLLLIVGPAVCVLASLLATHRLLGALRLAAVAAVLGLAWAPRAFGDAEVVTEPRTTRDFDADRMRRDLAGLQHRHERARADVDRLSGESRSLLAAIQELGRIEDALNARIKDLKGQVDGLEGDIAALEATIAVGRDRHRTLGERAVRLSRLVDRTAAPTDVDVLLADVPQGRLIRTRRIRDILLQHRLAAFGELERAQRELRRQRDRLERTRAERALLTRALETERQMQAGARAERHAMLQTVQSQQAVAAATIADLESAMRELDRVLAELPLGAPGARDFYGPIPLPELRGALPWPVEEGRVARRFGRRVAPVFLTVTHHDGWLLATPAGRPVYAVHDGRVEYAGWLHGYGKLVVLDHGGGHRTLYGHCATLFQSPGDVVRAGDVLATVGTTGPLEGPALYFAVRVHDTAQDPAAWLAPKDK